MIAETRIVQVPQSLADYDFPDNIIPAQLLQVFQDLLLLKLQLHPQRRIHRGDDKGVILEDFTRFAAMGFSFTDDFPPILNDEDLDSGGFDFIGPADSVHQFMHGSGS
jgi:hypothetical protein